MEDVVPGRATYRPGETARTTITVRNDDVARWARLSLALVQLDQTVDRWEEPLAMAPASTAAERHQATATMPLPPLAVWATIAFARTDDTA